MSESTEPAGFAADGPVPAVKYHGTGNDFLVVDAADADGRVLDRGTFAVHHCDRETGVEGGGRTGADGVLFMDITDDGDDGDDGSTGGGSDDGGVARATMTLVQPDASVAEMCGNGARCAAAWVRERTGAHVVDLVTPAGVRRAVVTDDDGDASPEVTVEVEMGNPSFAPADVPLAADRDGPLVEESVEGLTVTAVDTGVPHAVAVVDDVDAVDLEAVAPPVRHADAFPEGANVTFAERTGDDTFDQRTFERGVEGETLACGTGAVAVGAVAREVGVTTEPVLTVSPPGGPLQVTVPDDAPATLTGPAAREFAVDLAVPDSEDAAAGDFDPVEFLAEAARIDSHESPDTMREFLVETLAAHGADPSVDAAGNVRATKAAAASDGDADGPHLVVNTHIDTVAPHVPFERGTDEAGREVFRGRGSCDAKGPLAALLAGFLAVEPTRGRVTLAVTPDEETLSTGADALVRGRGDDHPEGAVDPVDGDLFLVGEPTDCDACVAARGRFEGTLTLTGSAAHAAEPGSGVNAVAALEDALAAVRAFDDDIEAHPTLRAPTLVATGVDGGEATNQVPAEATVMLDRRSVPPETAGGFRESLEAAVREAVADEVGVAFALTERPTPFLEAFDTDPNHSFVTAVSDAARSVGDDADGEVRPFGAATEASYFAPAPTVVFGPGHLADDAGAVAHSEREYVRVDRVRDAAETARRALDSLLE
jgi:diaminopimelate epimerase